MGTATCCCRSTRTAPNRAPAWTSAKSASRCTPWTTSPACCSCGPRRARWSATGCESALVVGLLQAFDVELLHLHQCLHHPVGFFGVFVCQQLAQHSGNDLPRQAILVREPA